MKLDKIRIENFRSIKKAELVFYDIVSLIGPNNAGKSNIIDAIKYILGKTYPTYSRIRYEDFHNRNTDSPIYVYLRFKDLTEEERKPFRKRNRSVMRKAGGKPVRGNYSDYLAVCLEVPYEQAAQFYYVGEDFEPIRYGDKTENKTYSVKKEDRNLFPVLISIPAVRESSRFFSGSPNYQWGEIISQIRDLANSDSLLKNKLEELLKVLRQKGEYKHIEDSIKDSVQSFLCKDNQEIDVSILPKEPGDIVNSLSMILDDGYKVSWKQRRRYEKYDFNSYFTFPA